MYSYLPSKIYLHENLYPFKQNTPSSFVDEERKKDDNRKRGERKKENSDTQKRKKGINRHDERSRSLFWAT